jgi:hypothetical protein
MEFYACFCISIACCFDAALINSQRRKFAQDFALKADAYLVLANSESSECSRESDRQSPLPLCVRACGLLVWTLLFVAR